MPWRGSIPLPPARRKLDARRAWQLAGIFDLGALQAALGISVLLLGVPVVIAAAHQGGAVLLLAATLWTAHRLYGLA